MIKKAIKEGSTIGYDPTLFSLNYLKSYKKAIDTLEWKPININLVDEIWVDKPTMSLEPAFIHDS